jgi:carboxymethylenebutenolidase
MTAGSRRERVSAHEEGEFSAHTVLPKEGSGPGLLVLHEIFGVGTYIRAAADRIADLGYVAMAPDLFWRLEPDIALDHDEAGLARGLELRQRLDVAAAVRDCDAALVHLRSLPEVTGGAGVLGFCMGGMLAYFTAVESDPDVAVSYYGSGVPDAIDLVGRIGCPTLFHFGGDDPYITPDHVEQVKAAIAGRDDMEAQVQPGAGHAFDNHEAPMFHNAQAAHNAWRITTAFLQRWLPPGR